MLGNYTVESSHGQALSNYTKIANQMTLATVCESTLVDPLHHWAAVLVYFHLVYFHLHHPSDQLKSRPSSYIISMEIAEWYRPAPWKRVSLDTMLPLRYES